MATTVAELEARLTANPRDFNRDIDRADRHFAKFGKAIRIGALAAGAAIGVVLAKSAKVGFDEFLEGQRVAAQTSAVLKSTGRIANVTAKQVDQLATSLMKKSGVDDEAIKSGSNMLLTFTRIRNEVGRGNDIFNQATKATLNLSVAMGKDMQSSAILVGKALNDPIKGMTALSRAGIQFTEEQKETIKQLVETGHSMDAQKIILKELETQFGGSAEAAGKTFGGQLNILRETFSNLAGEIVGRFVPHLVSLANFVAPLVIVAMDNIGRGLTAIGGFVTDHVLPRLRDLAGFIRESIIPAFGAIVAKIRESIIPALRDWTTELKERLTPAWRGLLSDARKTIEDVARVTVEKQSDLSQTWVNLRGILKELKELFSEVGGVIAFIMIPAFRNLIILLKTDFYETILKYAIPIIEDLTGEIRTLLRWINNVIDRIQDLIGWFKKIKVPSINIPGIGNQPNVYAPSPTGSGGDSHFTPKIHDEMAIARSMGGSIGPNSWGRTYGDHGRVPSHAIDVYGSASTLSNFATMMYGRPGSKDIFYSPHSYAQDNGRRIYGWGGLARERATHWDHVHYSVFDKGGWLKPGLTLAANNTGRPEPVGSGGFSEREIHLHIDGQKLMSWIQNADAQFRRGNGRGLLGTS
jgi:hypothetical protein